MDDVLSEGSIPGSSTSLFFYTVVQMECYGALDCGFATIERTFRFFYTLFIQTKHITYGTQGRNS